ncbi:MAG TPA: hypothetical protein VGN19_08135, partial [Pedococcus sp.]|nr:hypothetical protein [Pedococcus sp.]
MTQTRGPRPGDRRPRPSSAPTPPTAGRTAPRADTRTKAPTSKVSASKAGHGMAPSAKAGRPASRGTGAARPKAGAGSGSPRPGGSSRNPVGREVRLDAASPRRRMRAMTVVVLFVFSIFAAQLLRLQGFDASAVSADATSQRTATVALPAMRGSIVDSRGTILASSIERRTVTVDQTAVPSYVATVNGVRVKVGVDGAAKALSPLLGVPVDLLVGDLTGKARYRVLQKNVTPLTWRKISELGVNGIYSEVT